MPGVPRVGRGSDDCGKDRFQTSDVLNMGRFDEWGTRSKRESKNRCVEDVQTSSFVAKLVERRRKLNTKHHTLELTHPTPVNSR